MTIDPEIRAMMDAALAARGVPVAELPLPESRQVYSQRYRDRSLPPPDGIEFERREIPGPDGTITAGLYKPQQAPKALPLLIYFHGGGFVLGDVAGYHGQSAQFAKMIGCAVLVPEYRLAPEHPFPAALDDSIAVVNWAAQNAAQLGIDPQRIAVAGDSAGGNLAGNLAILSRDGKVSPLALQILFYPVTDYRHHFGGPDYPSLSQFAKGYWLDATAQEWFAQSYIKRPQDAFEPRVSLIVEENLAHLPPALIVTAANDPLRDMGKAYADRLASAGTDVEHWCIDGMIHNFLGHTGKSAAARAAFLRIAHFIADRFDVGMRADMDVK